jgi:hypothetical protein
MDNRRGALGQSKPKFVKFEPGKITFRSARESGAGHTGSEAA